MALVSSIYHNPNNAECESCGGSALPGLGRSIMAQSDLQIGL